MAVKEYPVIWLQGASCTGCSVSVLNAVSPKIQNLLLDELVPGKQINMRFHMTIMAGEGESVINVLRDTQKQKKGEYVLIVEGAIPTASNGIYGTIGEEGDKPATILSRVEDLGRDALLTIALGTCAAYGGIPSASPNPSGCKSVLEVFEEKNINPAANKNIKTINTFINLPMISDDESLIDEQVLVVWKDRGSL